ncbi:MAG: polysaccharide deacetylase family protein [Verrucomicrobiota bacterium]
MSVPPSSYYPRDYKGYGENPPNPQWPNGARIAVSLVLAIEAGAELSLADGDEANEAVQEILDPTQNIPAHCTASHFDYGPRAGYWRIIRALDKYGVKCSACCAARAIEKAPWIAQDLIARGHEISAHGYRWEGHADMDEAHEREIIQKTTDTIEAACGYRPIGWHTKGPPSNITRKLLVESGYLYDNDAYDDDLPRIQQVDGQPHVVVPYSFDTNDMRFQAGPVGKFLTSEDYAKVCIDAFDTLWEEGETAPKMLSVGVHDRFIGRPSRIPGLIKFLEHAHAKGEVWFARRMDIAHNWRKINNLPEFPYKQP